MNTHLKRESITIKRYIRGFFKWLAVGLALGAAGGIVGSAFHICVGEASALRHELPWLVWLLPVGGLAIALLHHVSHVALDTNIVIRAVQEKTGVSWLMAPLIFVSAVISHLFGASVGREGAALQIGGSMGYTFGSVCRMDVSDTHIAVMAGMAAVFSAVFGTPITAMLFSIEVASVGIMYYASLFPCLTASLTASAIARAFGVEAFAFAPVTAPEMSLAMAGRTLILSVALALLAIVFCILLSRGERCFRRLIKNDFLRIAAGGAAVAVLTWLWGSDIYNGAGSEGIYAAVSGSAGWADFFMKMIFTVISVGVGFKGGEIVPTLFIGSAFGCVFGGVLGLDPGFAAALGMIGLFCGMVNCPVASIIMSIELFGSAALPYFAIVCVLSFMLSGNFSLYRQQDFVAYRLKARLHGKFKRSFNILP